MSSVEREQWEIPLRERLAVVEADQKQMKDAIFEIKDAVVGIRSTLETVVRLEEKTLNLAQNDNRLERNIEEEKINRRTQAESYGKRLGDLEEDMSTLKTSTELNSHGRSMFEKILIPVIAGIFGSGLTLFGSYMIRDQVISNRPPPTEIRQNINP